MMFRYKDEVGDILKLPTDEVYKPNEKRNSKQRKTSVVVFDMSGTRVAEFPSVKGAAQSLGLLRSSISAVLSGAQKTCGNFIFKRSIDVVGCSVLDGDSVSMALSKPSAAKQILCYDLDGVYLRTYSSITEAANQLGISMKAIALRHGFKKYMKCDISSPIDWQEAIKEEAALVSAKTVFNRWNVISAAMRHVKVTPPDVTLPKFKKGGQPYLDFEQIRAFIPLIRGTTCEVAALLALHSLRLSELVNIKGRDIVVSKRGTAFINVSGSRVLDKNNKLIEKDTNKTYESTREIPVVIPRLLDILPDVAPDDYIVKLTPQAIGKQINKICKANDLPLVSVHGLRRSFASLGYHLGWPELRTMKFGGWTNIKTVHEHYLHEAQKDMDKSTKKMQKFYSDIEKCSK